MTFLVTIRLPGTFRLVRTTVKTFSTGKFRIVECYSVWLYVLTGAILRRIPEDMILYEV
jgi:hypothetical protein